MSDARPPLSPAQKEALLAAYSHSDGRTYTSHFSTGNALIRYGLAHRPFGASLYLIVLTEAGRDAAKKLAGES